MFVLKVIKEPGIHLYYVSGNKFSCDFKESYIFDSRTYAYEVQSYFLAKGLDLEIVDYNYEKSRV